MISVCIPVFNEDIRILADTLSKEAAELSSRGVEVEIILLDDGSQEEYRIINRSLRETDRDQAIIKSTQQESSTNDPGLLIYHELPENIGRAKIRNRFLEYAKYPYLLFLDCDLRIFSGDFLEKYIAAIQKYPDRVIVGGCNYDPGKPPRKYRLHWKYGIRKESRPAELRSLDPNRSFMTSNFIIPEDLLKEIRFDERLSGYGHEDSLFGYELTKKGHEIIHIDNPVIHEGLETNQVFVRKTAEAVRNLVYITSITGNEQGFKDSIRLIRSAEQLRFLWIGGLLRIILILINPLNRCLLNKGCTSLKLLDAFKLGCYLAVHRP